jgi:hypothetical protein
MAANRGKYNLSVDSNNDRMNQNGCQSRRDEEFLLNCINKITEKNSDKMIGR